VFKPFISAWALDKLGFDPHTQFACRLREDGKTGAFEDLRCAGHHEDSDLHRALVVSCNAYFAQLGLCFEPEQMVESARAFGFGEPTGARTPSTPGRYGLHEAWKMSALKTDEQVLAQLSARAARLRFPNGLDLLAATPMQVARATAGLATSILPEVRLVRTVGGVPLPRASRPLGLSERSLAFVRAAMRDVVEQPGGSGHGKRLDAQTLGFTLAIKTGSADIGKIVEIAGMPEEDREAGRAGKSRKHTWVAGWFPAEDPVAIVVVYLHNVTETSSRTAVHVTSQLLQTQAVRDLVARKGAQ
jgi:penicillin-binding protein 2